MIMPPDHAPRSLHHEQALYQVTRTYNSRFEWCSNRACSSLGFGTSAYCKPLEYGQYINETLQPRARSYLQISIILSISGLRRPRILKYTSPFWQLSCTRTGVRYSLPQKPQQKIWCQVFSLKQPPNSRIIIDPRASYISSLTETIGKSIEPGRSHGQELS